MKANTSDLLYALGYGRDSIRSSYSIARDLGCGQREVGFIVSRARKEGHLIGSVHGQGYYLILTRSELEETKAHIVSRIGGVLKTIKALDEAGSNL